MSETGTNYWLHVSYATRYYDVGSVDMMIRRTVGMHVAFVPDIVDNKHASIRRLHFLFAREDDAKARLLALQSAGLPFAFEASVGIDMLDLGGE